MKIYCVNALFSFKIKFNVGEKFIFGVAQATAFRLKALPLPPLVEININKNIISDKEKEKILKQQTLIKEMSACYHNFAVKSLTREILDYTYDDENIDNLKEVGIVKHKSQFEFDEDYFKDTLRQGQISKEIDELADEELMKSKADGKGGAISPADLQIELANIAEESKESRKSSLILDKEEIKEDFDKKLENVDIMLHHKPSRKLSDVIECNKNSEEESDSVSRYDRSPNLSKKTSQYEQKSLAFQSFGRSKPSEKDNFDGAYFETLKDEKLIKTSDRDIEELIASNQLHNTSFMIEVDDLKELDTLNILVDPLTPKNMKIYTTE